MTRSDSLQSLTPLQQGCTKSCAVGICTQLQTVSKKNLGHIHHQCVLYTASRYQGQCRMHLHAILQVCFSQSSHCCQGDQIPLDFASVHQLVRNRTDEANVYSEAESKVLVLCIVSIERRRLAQTSQALEQLCIQRSSSSGHNRSQVPWRFRRSVVSTNQQSQRTGSATMCDIKMTVCTVLVLQRHKRQIELKACSIHVRARVKMSDVQLSCVCLWIS